MSPKNSTQMENTKFCSLKHCIAIDIDSKLRFVFYFGAFGGRVLKGEDTLLPMFLGLRELGNICCGHKCF